MSIDMVKVRAKVMVGSLSVVTPYILSFNVTKNRGAVSTFSASLKVKDSSLSGSLSGTSIKIAAGSGSASNLIFTGIVKKASLSPCWDDPHYVIVNISGEDILSVLRGKRYTRRCRSSRSSWVNITGVVRKGLKSGKFKVRREESFLVCSSELEENSKVIRNNVKDADTKISSAPVKDERRPGVPIQISIVELGEEAELG